MYESIIVTFTQLTEVTLTGTGGANVLLAVEEEHANVIGSAPIPNRNMVEKIVRNWGPSVRQKFVIQLDVQVHIFCV